jgi:hypothetical protein
MVETGGGRTINPGDSKSLSLREVALSGRGCDPGINAGFRSGSADAGSGDELCAETATVVTGICRGCGFDSGVTVAGSVGGMAEVMGLGGSETNGDL